MSNGSVTVKKNKTLDKFTVTLVHPVYSVYLYRKAELTCALPCAVDATAVLTGSQIDEPSL